jgi:tetratricopeptide (TPR) repeat protein
VDWGNTQNFKNFILHLAGYEAYHLFSKGTFFTNLKFLVQNSFSQFNLLLLLFPIGIYSLFYKKKLLFIFTSVVFLTNSLFYLSSAAQAPQFYLISFVMISIWLGEGLTVIFNKLKKLLLKYLFLGVIVFLLGSIFFKNFDLNNRRGNISAYLYGRELLKRANQNAIIVTRNSVIYFLTQYFQKVENFRRDVKVIFENILRFPWYLESLVKKEKALPPECLKIAQRISESREKGSVSKLMNQLFTLSLSRLPLYLPYFDYFFWEEKLKEKGLVCIPEGLLLRVRKTIPEEFPEIVVHPIPYDKYSQPFWSDTYQVFGDIYYNLGNQCLRHRYFQKALSLYQRSLALVPGKGDIYNNIGVCYAQLNSLPKALFYFKKAHFFNPNLREPYFNLAKIYLRLKDFNKASFWARKGLKIIPESASLKGILHQSEKGN